VRRQTGILRSWRQNWRVKKWEKFTLLKQGKKLPPNGNNEQGFLRTPWNATSRTTAQDALWQHVLNRNTSSQPFMTPCARQVMNRIPGDLTPPWAVCWGPPRSYLVSEAIYSPAQRNLRTARPTPQTETPHTTQRSEPPSEKGGPLTCSPYKQSGGSSRSCSPRPSVSLQRERISHCSCPGGQLRGSWSGLSWLSYTSRGRNLK